MTTILIADAIKPSLVMSSEVFKDKIPGAEILVTRSGEEAVRVAEERRPDLCVVDFDLPDVDGPSLILALRKVYAGPILMTAFPDPGVDQAVDECLFAFNDASAWIRKPVKFDDLAAQIDRFLVQRQRTGRRFHADLPMQLIAKAEGRGKRAPKGTGKVVNISLGGACIELESALKVKTKQEMTLSFNLPDAPEAKPTSSTTAGRKKTAKSAAAKKSAETKIKAKVAWTTNKGQIGLEFCKLTDVQHKGLEMFLRSGV